LTDPGRRTEKKYIISHVTLEGKSRVWWAWKWPQRFLPAALLSSTPGFVLRWLGGAGSALASVRALRRFAWMSHHEGH